MKWISQEASLNLAAQGYSEWVKGLDRLVEEVLEKENLLPIEPIWGGKSGALLRVEPEGVLKLIPLDVAKEQIEAHRLLSGQSCPRLYKSSEEEGWVLMEYLRGKPVSKKKPLSLEAATKILENIWQSPLPESQTSYRKTISSWMSAGSIEPEKEIVAVLLESALSADCVHLHGDIGVHNLFLREKELLFVDPNGVVGPREWDLGCLATWSGRRKKQIPESVALLANLCQVSSREVMRWALVRMACSSILGLQRNNMAQHRECHEALRDLWPAWQKEYQ